MGEKGKDSRGGKGVEGWSSGWWRRDSAEERIVERSLLGAQLT